MNAKKAALEKIAKLQEEIDALQKIVGTPVRWRAKNNSQYFLIRTDGYTAQSADEDHEFDDRRYQLGNYYQTEEEAELASKKLFATQRLKDRIAELNALEGREQGFLKKGVNSVFYYDSDTGLSWIEVDVVLHEPWCYGSDETMEIVINEMASDILLYLGVTE